MTINIRNLEAEALARRPSETAQHLLARRGLAFKPGRKPVPDSAWHDLDHDLAEGG